MLQLSQTSPQYSLARENKHISVNNSSTVEIYFLGAVHQRYKKLSLSLEVLSVGC